MVLQNQFPMVDAYNASHRGDTAGFGSAMNLAGHAKGRTTTMVIRFVFETRQRGYVGWATSQEHKLWLKPYGLAIYRQFN